MFAKVPRTLKIWGLNFGTFSTRLLALIWSHLSQSVGAINGADLNATSAQSAHNTSRAGLKSRFFLQMHHAGESENAVPSPKKGPASAVAARHAAAAAAEDGFYFIYTMVWITNRCEESDGLRKTKATRHQQLKTHMQSSPSQKYPSGRANISLSCAPHRRVFIYLRAAGCCWPEPRSQRADRAARRNDISHKGEIMPPFIIVCSSYSARYCYDYGPGL